MAVKEQGGVGNYLWSKDFRYTIIAILVFLGIFILASFLWLKLYTHHGQELEMPDYTGYSYDEAIRDARRKKFRMSVQDSLHILGKPGGEILKQNPVPGALVKANRMIYVTITKRSPDQILSGRLPEMYGKNYERKKRELEEHFEIKSRIADTRFDPAEPGQILEVSYKGKIILDAKGRDNTVQIEKGEYLDFVISSRSGGRVIIPDLRCKTVEEVGFLLDNLGLRIGDILKEGTIDDLEAAYVISQTPEASDAGIEMGSSIQLSVSQSKHDWCE
jgi:beta-lactam-binding protein with PASTA domain